MAPPTRATAVRVESRPETVSPVAAFDAAAAAASANPRDEAPWEHLEELVAADEAQARAVLELYRGHLGKPLPMPLREIVVHRAVRFAADCFGENATESVEVLRAVLAGTPDADWAFRPLVVALTMTERWADVLDAYDARLAAGGGAERRASLLEEAARIAKDFTRDHGRAIGYLERLYHMRPDAAVVASLERLLERERRWEDLVGLTRTRLEGGSAEETRALRLHLASVLHDELGRAADALEALRPLAGEPGPDATLAERLEAIFIDERAPAETRFDALGALRPRLEAADQDARVPMLLAIAIGLATGRRLLELRRECGERLFVLGDLAGALAQYEALIALAPEDTEIEDRLRQLAELGREPARLARGLVAAAGACAVGARRVELLMRAARLEDRRLARKVEAAALFESVAADEGAPEEARLEALRRLDELYDELAEPVARLAALERLAAIEPKAAEKRLVWAVVARLALGRGEIDRALAAWQARLTLDASDVEALAAARALLVEAQRWPALIDLLWRRIESAPAPHQIRADLAEIALIARDQLRDLPRAIEAWREIIARFGEDEASVGALADLLDESGAFAELCELLQRRAGVDRRAHADRLARLAAALGAKRDDVAGAVEWYGHALEVEPAHEGARAGLLALVGDKELGARAASSLARAAEHTGSWQLLLDLVPHRLAGLNEAAARARLLEEAAALAEERANDRALAFGWLCEALPLAGGSLALEREVLRLAEATGGFARAAAALAETIGAGALPPLPLAHLHERRAALLEERLEDLRGARESYAAALAIVPERLEARRSLLRATMRLGDFAAAAALVVEPAVSPAVRDTILLPLYESLARESARLPETVAALADAADRAEGLDPRTRRELHARVAGALLGDCQDPAAADAALGRALGADPGHVPTLRRRADLQRERQDAGLVGTLERLAREQPNDLDFLREAAELALAHGEEPLAIDLLGRLGDQAMRLARVGAGAAGKHAPVDVAVWAVDALVGLHVAAGAPERLRAAVALLLEGARLPAAAPVRHGWLRRAAELTEGRLGDSSEAIRVWRALHEEAPDDAAAREALARLYERERRFADVTSLRVAELEAANGAERRLALRLEIVRVGGLLEQQSRAADVLRANLAERPGHDETVRRLAEILLQKGKAGDLADVLEQQAIVLGEEGQPAASSALWAELARLCESHLANAPRAIAAWERAVGLEPTVEALDALGRLVLAAGDAAAAAGWLDRRLAMTGGEPRVGVAAALATAYLAAGQRHRAVACLERAIDEQPRADALRGRLSELYREAEAWEPLARVLAEGCEHTDDAAVVVARAKEAGEAYARVGMVGRAVPVLERAVRLAPKDEVLRLALADGLKQGGRLDDARAELLQLVEQAGWRKSRKRAAVHQRLGELARAQGDLPAALEQLELASSMDASNLDSLRQLAEVAQESDALERAERAYRALLVRRTEAETTATHDHELAATEILLRLFALARQRGHEGEADELLDSALATALKDPHEAQRLQRGLLASGANDVLDRLFEKRLTFTVGTPAQADVHAERAEMLRAQGRLDEAFEAQCLAVEVAPERAPLHEPLIELARTTGKVAALADRLLALVERRRRKAESGVASAVLLRAADIAEQDFGDDARALELHRRAEELDPRSLIVLSGLGRLAAKRGDHAEHERVAASLVKIAAEAATNGAAAEALYRAATLQLGRAESREAGLASLAAAVEKSPDLERASAIVVEAAVPQAELVKILPLYERIARQSGDEGLLLDYLERQAATPAATVAEVREAVDLAVALGESERVEPLLERLAELGAGRAESRRDVAWALLELIQRKKAAGDLEGAARVLVRAADSEAIDAERVLTLARELADRAARAKNPRVAAELLERVRVRAPNDESVWRPLLDHYVALQDRAGLERVVAETLPLLPEVGQRNHLRLARARVLLGADGRDSAAADILRDVLLEERRHPEALALLAKHYEACGAEDDLVDLLEQRFDAAIETADADEIVEAALQLGAAVAGRSPERAAAFYERALAAAPRRRELLERLLSSHEGDATPAHARRMEELLALETGEPAARLALELAATWGKLGDQAGVRRVLERGHAQAPADRALAEELERLYRGRESWGLLAGLLSERAEHEPDATRAAAMLVEAADLRQQQLADTGAAIDLLRAALARTPGDTALVERLARALVANGDVERASSEVATALARPELAPADRVSLSLVRAELEGARGQHKAAVTVLREALALAPEAVADALEAAVEAWRASTAGAADIREATLALAELARRRGDVGHARELVSALLGQGDVEPDLETTRLAAELAEEAGDVGGAVDATYYLMQLERGERQVAAARRLVDLAAQADRAADAMAAVEAVVAAGPDEQGLVDLLAGLYEQAGERGKLAALLYEAAGRADSESVRFERLQRAGALALEIGDGSMGVMALNDALAIRPGDLAVSLLLADAYVVAGAPDEAAALLKPLVADRKIKPSPMVAAVHARLARIAGQAGDNKEELAAWTRALDADKKDGALVAEVADRAEAVGDLDLALKALRLIVANNTAGPISLAEAFLRQARISHRRGESDRALSFARRAAQDAPKGDAVQRAARELIESIEATPGRSQR